MYWLSAEPTPFLWNIANIDWARRVWADPYIQSSSIQVLVGSCHPSSHHAAPPNFHADSGLDGGMQDAPLSFGSIYNLRSFGCVVDDFNDVMCTHSKSHNTSLGADCSACSPHFGWWQLTFFNQRSDVNTESNIITGIASSSCFTWAHRHRHCTSSCIGGLK